MWRSHYKFEHPEVVAWLWVSHWLLYFVFLSLSSFLFKLLLYLLEMTDNLRLPTSTPLHGVKSTQNTGRVGPDSTYQGESSKSKEELQPDLSLAHRTRALFNVISRPPLLCAPSYGIKLPFDDENKTKAPGLEKASDELKDLVCSDPCLLSLDGLLDGLYVIRNVMEYVFDECEKKQSLKGDEPLAATLNVLDFFLSRSRFRQSSLSFSI